MKYLSLFLLVFLNLTLNAQSAPEVEGDLLASGSLRYENRVRGYFRLTDNSLDEENFVYNLTLLGKDLQPLGSKLYKSNQPLSFEDIAYNGRYLGVLFQGEEENSSRFLDILNSDGERIKRSELNSVKISRGMGLYPREEGFIAAVAHVQSNRIVFDLKLVPSDEEKEGWKETYSAKSDGIMPRLIANTKDRLLFSVEGTDPYHGRMYQSVYCIDPTTGAFNYSFQDKKYASSKSFPKMIASSPIGEELLTAYRQVAVRKGKIAKGFILKLHDVEGELLQEKRFDEKKLFDEALAKVGLPALAKGARVERLGLEVNEEGVVTVAYEVFTDRNEQGKSIRGYEYKDGYVVAISPDFEVASMAKVEKTHFRLTKESVRELYPGEKARLRKAMRKGKYNRLALEDLVSLHDGPYGFTLTDRGEDYISNYFLDRVIAKEGVTYSGVRVATYIDGEFEFDYIPFKNKPDFVALSRAHEGYVKITEYKYGEGVVDIRLERLSY